MKTNDNICVHMYFQIRLYCLDPQTYLHFYFTPTLGHFGIKLRGKKHGLKEITYQGRQPLQLEKHLMLIQCQQRPSQILESLIR